MSKPTLLFRQAGSFLRSLMFRAQPAGLSTVPTTATAPSIPAPLSLTSFASSSRSSLSTPSAVTSVRSLAPTSTATHYAVNGSARLTRQRAQRVRLEGKQRRREEEEGDGAGEEEREDGHEEREDPTRNATPFLTYPPDAKRGSVVVTQVRLTKAAAAFRCHRLRFAHPRPPLPCVRGAVCP